MTHYISGSDAFDLMGTLRRGRTYEQEEFESTIHRPAIALQTFLSGALRRNLSKFAQNMCTDSPAARQDDVPPSCTFPLCRLRRVDDEIALTNRD